MPVALTAEDAHRRRRREIRAHVVDVHQLPHLIGRDVVDRAGDAEAGVAHHHVEAAKSFNRAGDEAFDLVWSGHVRSHRERLTSRRDDVGGHGIEPIRAPRTERHRSAIARETQRSRAPDARGRAGDCDNALHHASICEGHGFVSCFRAFVAT